MAYIPPHKRHSNAMVRPSPVPESLVPQFKRNLKLTSYIPNNAGKIVYANDAVYRWCAVGMSDDNQFPSSIHLQPISLESVGRNTEEKPLILVNDQTIEEVSRNPWIAVAETVQGDLLSCLDIVRKEMGSQELLDWKPTMVARFGKILFHGTPTFSLDTARKFPVAESTLRRLKRSFYTGVPASYIENILDKVIPKIGLDYVEKKDTYHVKLSDSKQPDVTISCKCTVNQDKRLELYKVELDPVRHTVVDISCLNKNIDMRLIFYTTKIVTTLTDVEKDSIRDLLNSAVLDPDVRGGLRWPMGKSFSGDRYGAIEVWHTVATSYKGPSLRLKVRDVDRYDFRASTGKATRDAVLKMKRLASEMQEKAEDNSISDMLKDTIKLMWEHFLSSEPFLT